MTKVKHCCVSGCDTTNENSDRHLFNFPRREPNLNRWKIAVVNNLKPQMERRKVPLICDLHFDASHILNHNQVFHGQDHTSTPRQRVRLELNAVPTIFPINNNTNPVSDPTLPTSRAAYMREYRKCKKESLQNNGPTIPKKAKQNSTAITTTNANISIKIEANRDSTTLVATHQQQQINNQKTSTVGSSGNVLAESSDSGPFHTSAIENYVNAEQLKFLSKVNYPRSTEDSLSINSADEDTEPIVSENDNRNKSGQFKIPPRKQLGSRKRKLDEVDMRILNALEKPEDRHISFFKGILPTLHTFTEDETVNFQMGVLQLLTNIKQRVQTQNPNTYLNSQSLAAYNDINYNKYL